MGAPLLPSDTCRTYLQRVVIAGPAAAGRLQLLRLISGSLALKIALIMGLLITGGGGVFWYTSLKNDRQNLLDTAITFVSSFAEVVKRSVRNDMLYSRRDDLQRTVETIAATATIKKVRIFSAGGVIAYSSTKEEIGQRFTPDSRACIGCHSDPSGPSELPLKDRRWDIYTDASGSRILSYVEPIHNEPDCASAACHAHPDHQKVLGILTTDFSLQPIDTLIRKQNVEASLYFLVFLAASGSMLYYVLWRFVLRPVQSLSGAMEAISHGDLSQKVRPESDDDLGRLASTFNVMSDELTAARRRMDRWTKDLEEDVRNKTDEIFRTHGKLLQAEKMAALGRLTAEIAHEIRNPLTAVGGYGRRLQRLLTTRREKEYSDIIVAEVHRLEIVLRDVLSFSRDVRMCFEKRTVTPMVAECVLAYSALCDENAITVSAQYHANAAVLLDTTQARHAVNNLIGNAIDAMPGGGVLSVDTVLEKRHAASYVAIHVSDNGSGIPEDNLPLIFEPFYTTKEIGRGTGLGLATSRKIMEEHGGFIAAANRKGGGLTASLYFPYQSDEDLSRTPCWEFMRCGRETGREIKCPAYPHFGRVCWVVGGTYCEGRVQGTFAQKYEDCSRCDFHLKALAGEI